MSAPKHTPGPWRVVMGHYRLRVDGKRRFADANAESVVMSGSIEAGNYRRVADCRDEDEANLEVDAANARLIAAAPELFEALKGALAALTQPATFPADVECARVYLRTAIVKVEGLYQCIGEPKP